MTSQPIISRDDCQMPLFVGVDVGATTIKLGVVDDAGSTLAFDRVATDPEGDPDEAIARVAQALQAMWQQIGAEASDLVATGLGSPGTMDIPAGMLLEPPNMPGWHHFPIRDRLSRAIGLPVAFANDAAAAAYGEFWIGSGREHGSMIMLTLGTGVGGGIIHHGHSIDGAHSHGAECGHIIIDSRADARRCSCGQTGHLEAYASATAVVKRTQDALDSGRASSLRRRLDAGESLSALLVAEEADASDELAREIVDQTADYLGLGITTLVHTIDPESVILGGAMDFGGSQSPLGRRFLDRIRQRFQSLAFPVPAAETVIEFASLGGDAGYLGAAGIARSRQGK